MAPLCEWINARAKRLNSRLYQQAEDGSCFPLKNKTLVVLKLPPVIIGDAAYPLLNWLLKPFWETMNSTAEEKLFNYRLSRARMVVENAFGRLNGSFRILMKRNDWHWYNIDDGGRMRYPAQHLWDKWWCLWWGMVDRSREFIARWQWQTKASGTNNWFTD